MAWFRYKISRVKKFEVFQKRYNFLAIQKRTMFVTDFKPIVVTDAQTLSELMANLKFTLEPKISVDVKPSLVLPFYQGALHFFSYLTWEGDRAMYNDITFIRNDKGQFDAAHLLSQCNIDGEKSTKSIADYLTTSPGKELRKRGCFVGTTFVDYKWLEAMLTYGMKDAVAMTDYLEGREWRRVEGYLYLVKFIEADGRIVYKVGRTGDLDNRAKGYRNEAKKRGAAFYELVTLKVDNMYVSERVLINHFETHGAVHLPSKGKEYFTMYTADVSELAHDVRARELFQQATQ